MGNGSFETVEHFLPNIYNGDVDLGDFDNDNDLDILLIGMTDYEQKILQLFRNNGNYNFTSISGDLPKYGG